MYPDTSKVCLTEMERLKMSLAEVFEFGSEQRAYWSEERKLIRDTARSFAIEEVLPVANKLIQKRRDTPKPSRQNGRLGFFGLLSLKIWAGLV